MKALILLLTLSISVSTLAVDFNDIAGEYEITTEYAPIVNNIVIDTEGNIKLSEVSRFGTFVCEGPAVIEKSILSSSVICENGAEFTQKVDLTGVTNFKQFTRKPRQMQYLLGKLS